MIAAAAALAFALGCGASGSDGGGGSGLFKPCALDERAGGFIVQLNEEALGNPAHTAVSGAVLSGVRPTNVWLPEGAAAGGCRLMVGAGYSCAPACTSPQVCGPGGACVDNPAATSVGDVTITGVGPAPMVLGPLSANAPIYSAALEQPFPPFTPGAEIALSAAGGAVSAFSLEGAGFEPLVFPGTGIMAVGGQPLSFTWTAPAQRGSARIFAVMEIGHHGGVAARVECDLPDTGSGQIPASIVSTLIAKGVHGFPTLSLSRETVDSTTLAAGCVDFTVAAFVEHGITVCPTAGACVVSCSCGGDLSPCTGTDTAEIPCPNATTCQADYTCK